VGVGDGVVVGRAGVAGRGGAGTNGAGAALEDRGVAAGNACAAGGTVGEGTLGRNGGVIAGALNSGGFDACGGAVGAAATDDGVRAWPCGRALPEVGVVWPVGAGIEMIPLHTEQRARTPFGGTFAGSTLKMERQSGQLTFIQPLRSCESRGWPAKAPAA
jgi:hypothetical protein